MPMTPDEFALRMREIFPADDSHDKEQGHIDGDDLMCKLLTDLGYGEGAKIFADAGKWYA